MDKYLHLAEGRNEYYKVLKNLGGVADAFQRQLKTSLQHYLNHLSRCLKI